MGKRGPTPEPTAVKNLKGNPGKRPLPANEARVDTIVNLPKPPSFLLPLAKKHWKSLGAQLSEYGLLTDLDLDAFAACCNAYATWVDAQQQLKKTGMLVRSPNGYPMPSPYISISEKALDRMLKYQKEFGLTPSARSGIDVGAEEEPDDALDNLIKMKSQA